MNLRLTDAIKRMTLAVRKLLMEEVIEKGLGLNLQTHLD